MKRTDKLVFTTALFTVGSHSVFFKRAINDKYRFDITVQYNNLTYSWNGNHAPNITNAEMYVRFAKAEFDDMGEKAKYE